MIPVRFGRATAASFLGVLWILGIPPTRAAEADRGGPPREARAGKQNAATRPPLEPAGAGISWVKLPGGSFMMGHKNYAAERPVHQVTLKSFEMAKTLVTFKQYQACVKAGVCTPPSVSDGKCWHWNGKKWEQGNLPDSFQQDDLPVVCVDWEQAAAFARWVGGRLPTEAEWEYAARSGGKDRIYPWGNERAACDRAVLYDGKRGCGRDATWPVCSKPAGNTEQGLCDMAGNAWVWIQDWHHPSYDGAPADGAAWENPPGTRRSLRGGSWFDDAGNLCADNRAHLAPAVRGSRVGLRPVKSSP